MTTLETKLELILIAPLDGVCVELAGVEAVGEAGTGEAGAAAAGVDEGDESD